MSIKKLWLSALLLTTTGFAYAQDNCVKLAEGGVIVATVDNKNQGKVNINLENTDDWCAMQFDLYLPKNVTLVQATRTNRLKYENDDEEIENFNVERAEQTDGAWRFVIFNTKNVPVQEDGDNKGILTIRLVADDLVTTGLQKVEIKNVILSNSVDTSSGTATVTGFNAEDTETNVTIKIDAKIGEGGYGTFSWPRDVDFTGVEGVEEVYVAQGAAVNGWLHLDPIADKKVPAGTGVFIKGTAGATVNPETTTEEVAALSSTLGETSAEPYKAGDNVFALATKNGKTALYPVTKGVEIPKYKAYMTGESGAKFISFGDTATSIDALDMAEEDSDIYTLGGQKVQKTTMKGVYIKNGQKVVVK